MTAAPARYRCNACGATFTTWAPAERHADVEHHHRVELTLDPTPTTRRATA